MTMQEELIKRIAEVVGPKGDRWVLDESLKTVAEELVERYSEDLGHVKLAHVVFVRAMGVSNTKWLGKCKYTGDALNMIVPRYVIATLGGLGMLDLSQLRGLEADLMDLRYIIILNDSALRLKAGIGAEADTLKETLEAITLYHEMYHIKPAMDGLVTHDIQDFAKVLHRFGVYWTNGIIEQRQVVDPAEAEEGAARFIEDMNGEGGHIPLPPIGMPPAGEE
jgi:hypothetical protein